MLVPRPNDSLESTLPVRRLNVVAAAATPTGRQELRAYRKQDAEARTEIRGLALSQFVVQARVRAKQAVADDVLSTHSYLEERVVQSQARSTGIFRSACELEPGAIGQLSAIHETANADRQALMHMLGQVLGSEVSDLERW